MSESRSALTRLCWMSSTSTLPSSTIQNDISRQSDTARRIAKYTIISSLAGGTLTALYESTVGRASAVRKLEANARTGTTLGSKEIARPPSRGIGNSIVRGEPAKFYRHNTALLSASAALNTGIVAFAFFSLREHVISPLFTRNGTEAMRLDASDRQLTWRAMRKHHIGETAITGALLGGAFNAWNKGLRGIFRGAFTASLACTALQIVVNELDVQRIRYVSRVNQPSPSTGPETSRISPTPQEMISLDEKVVPPMNFNTIDTHSTATDKTKSGSTLGERMLVLIGITKVDDEEYLRRLKAKRDVHLARIRELEAQIERENATGVQSGSDGGGAGSTSDESHSRMEYRK